MIEMLEQSDKGFKVSIITMFQKAITNMHETNEKAEISAKEEDLQYEQQVLQKRKSQISNLNSHLKTKDQNKPRASRIKQKIKISTEINETEKRKQCEKSMKQKQQ